MHKEISDVLRNNRISIPKKIRKKYVNTIILSDIHLGSEVARPEIALKALKKYKFRRLILLGDIFDDLNFKRLRKNHWEFLSYIRKLSNPKRNIKVVWVEGNHDEGLSEIMSLLIGIKVYKEYKFIINNKRILAIHGHQFDRFLNENVIISNIASYIYLKIQKWSTEKQTLARFIKRKSKGWLRLANKVADGAIEYAKHKNADIVICGHTHLYTTKAYKNHDIEYYNSGCLTEVPSSYLTIDDSGNVISHILI